MRKIIAAAAVAIALSGCAAFKAIEAGQSFAITQNEVDTARNGYDAAFLAPLKNYRALGYCATGAVITVAHPCADRGVTDKLRSADKSVEAEFDALQAQINAGNMTGLGAAYTALQTSITNAEQLALSLGVK